MHNHEPDHEEPTSCTSLSLYSAPRTGLLLHGHDPRTLLLRSTDTIHGHSTSSCAVHYFPRPLFPPSNFYFPRRTNSLTSTTTVKYCSSAQDVQRSTGLQKKCHGPGRRGLINRRSGSGSSSYTSRQEITPRDKGRRVPVLFVLWVLSLQKLLYAAYVSKRR